MIKWVSMASRYFHRSIGLATLVCAALAAAGGCANDNPTTSAGGSGGAVTGVTGSTHASSTSQQSSSSTTVGSTTASTTASSTTASSTGTGAACSDPGPGEPNDTLVNAYQLPPISDCNSDAAMVSGMLGPNGPNGGDVDWYKYDGSDTFGCVVDPTRQLIGPTMRVCKYLGCTAAQVTCPSGSQFDVFAGKPGCCWMGGAEVTASLNCNGTDDSSTVYIRVDHPNGPGCETYQLNYHF